MSQTTTRIRPYFAVATTKKKHLSTSSLFQDLFHPTEEHAQLRRMLRDFVQKEVRTTIYLEAYWICLVLNFSITKKHILPLLLLLGRTPSLGIQSKRTIQFATLSKIGRLGIVGIDLSNRVWRFGNGCHGQCVGP